MFYAEENAFLRRLTEGRLRNIIGKGKHPNGCRRGATEGGGDSVNDQLCKNVFSDMPILEYEHILLRPYRDSDVRDFNEYMREDEVARYLSWSPHLNLHETKGYVSYMIHCYRKARPSDWAVVLKENGKVIGNCGFTSVDVRNESAELGYVLSPFYRGKGYMKEAMNGVLHVCFDWLQAHRAYLRILDGNDPSRGFAERLGFRPEGLLVNAEFIKGEYRSVWIYAMLEQEYARRYLLKEF